MKDIEGTSLSFGDRIINFFSSLSTRFSLLSEVARANIYGILLLIIIYLFYWTFPQAKDLLLTINQENHIQIGLFFASLITLAGICWYMPRFFYKENSEHHDNSNDYGYSTNKGESSYTEQEMPAAERKTWREFLTADLKGHTMNYDGEKEDYESKEAYYNSCYDKQFKEMIPRILASSLLFIVTLGILNVANEMGSGKFPWNISAYLVLGVLVLSLFSILIFEQGEKPLLFNITLWVEGRIKKRASTKYVILGYFILTGILLILLMLTKRGGFEDLPYLFTASLLLSLAFLVFTICRRWIPVLNKDSNVRYPLGVLALFLSFLFVLINIFPSLAQMMNPLVCANLAFVFYLTVLYMISLWGLRNKVNMVFFLILGVFILGSITSSFRNHEVTYVPNKINPDLRMDMGSYFSDWVDQRSEHIENYLRENPNDSFPVIVVSAEGGGSRAAYWTANIHGYLAQNIPGYYDNHLLAMTGASGGSTGNCTFYAMQKAAVGLDRMNPLLDTMFTANYLSSSLTLLMGADLIKDVLGLPVGRNRARQLEKEWAEKLQLLVGNEARNIFNEPFLELWYEGETNPRLRTDAGPLLFINMTHIQGAGHAVVSPLKLQSSSYFGLDLLDTMYKVNSTRTLKIVTANLLNASFPYINPAGQIEGVGSFVDAGYFDNYGARTGAALIQELSELRENAPDSSLYKKIKIISVLMRNSTADSSPPSDKPSSQLVAPISTLGGIRRAVNSQNFWFLENTADAFYTIDLKREKITPVEGGAEILPIIPLARYLSSTATKAMDESLKVKKADPNSNLRQLQSEFKGSQE